MFREDVVTNKLTFRARSIYSGESAPLENAVIEIEDGIVTDLVENSDLPATDLGNVAIIPGLVNAHTHLEFSHLANPVEPFLPFTNWIRNVVLERKNRKEDVAEIVTRGMKECMESGQTTLGEISTDDEIYESISLPHPKTVVFREILGLNPTDIESNLQITRKHLERFSVTGVTADLPSSAEGNQSRDCQGAGPLNNSRGSDHHAGSHNIIPALSPHAPYSVHPHLFSQLVELAKTENVPIAMHLAETQAELQLLDKGEGEFVEMLEDFGVWQKGIFSPGIKPLEYLRQLAKVSHALVVHGNYLDADEIAFLSAQSHMTLIYCPRTHAAFGHTNHPWRRVLEQGGHIALGTDSRASNPDLSLWNELCFLKIQFPQYDDVLLLQLATQNGARALGLERETGTLLPGKTADLAIVKLQDGSFSTLFHSSHRICGTMLAGDWIFSAGLQ